MSVQQDALPMPALQQIRERDGPGPSLQIYKHADADRRFRRKPSTFRSFISSNPSSEFPAQKDLYVLYLGYGCPWAHPQGTRRHHRAGGARPGARPRRVALLPPVWVAERDPLYEFKLLKGLFLKADPQYEGRYTIPILWVKQRQTIVDNESREIIRMFYAEFDNLLPEAMREVDQAGGGLYPAPLRADIDAMNERVYDRIDNGWSRRGKRTRRTCTRCPSAGRVEEHLGQPGHRSYLLGAKIRPYTTIARFDVAYYLISRCLRMIRHDYQHIDRWYRRLYYDESDRRRGAFRRRTFFDLYIIRYRKATVKQSDAPLIVPAGPGPDILPWED